MFTVATATIADKLTTLKPEMALAAGACLCLIVGLAPRLDLRRLCPWIAGLSLLAAGSLVYLDVRQGFPPPALGWYVKLMTVGIGLLLLMLMAGLPATWRHTRDNEPDPKRFDPGDAMGGEFLMFFLVSLIGLMLCAGGDDLIWLFLALELVSLPTYIMVGVSCPRMTAREAAVKYFFLSAMAGAVLLLGFTFIYGATGFTNLAAIADANAAAADGPSALMIAGLMLAVLGIAFKIAAVPMHFYAADVYQGAAIPVTALLAFVPKAAGFIALMLLLQTTAALPEPMIALLWLMAAATMTVGNVLALLQNSVKRILAYSSIAHSGYMLVGLLAPPQGFASAENAALGNGYTAILYYLAGYALATIAAFAVLGMLRRGGEEADDIDDLAGLATRHPMLAGVMVVSMLSLIGLPPMIGFLGKVYLFGSVITQADGRLDFLLLVVIGVLNSAVSAVYYLRIAAVCFFSAPGQGVALAVAPARTASALIAAIMVPLLGVFASPLVDASRRAWPGPQREYPTFNVQLDTRTDDITPSTVSPSAVSQRSQPDADTPAG
jgi:NADH-quinone oxidoreductase subunit N